MTEEKILQEAMKKAIKNGFKGTFFYNTKQRNEGDLYYAKNHEMCNSGIMTDRYRLVYFSHDFAKAFWGNCKTSKEHHPCLAIDADKIPKDIKPLEFLEVMKKNGKLITKFLKDDGIAIIPCWHHHLQQMVLEENPIQYLSKFI